MDETTNADTPATQRPLVTADELAGPDGPAWFSELFAASQTRDWPDRARVITVDASRVGTGQVGDSVRFTLGWDSPEAGPTSVVGKFPSHDPQTRATARMVQTYERECGFYSDLHRRVALRTPDIFHVHIDPSTGDFTLIMEDLSEAVQGDQLAGCGLSAALAIADAAAGLHGPTWPMTDTCGDVAWLTAPDPTATAERAGLYRALADGFIERYRTRLDAAVAHAVRWLGERIEAVHAALVSLDAVEVCVVHNDFRLDNMLFGDGDSAPPLTTVDWQTVAGGYGPVDLAYATGSGMVPDVRERHETEVFERYLAQLQHHGVDGLDTEAMRSQMWDGYRLGSTTGLAMAVVASMIVGRTARGDEMFCVMAERHAAQMDALGVAELLS
jgi:hypothetical protein